MQISNYIVKNPIFNVNNNPKNYKINNVQKQTNPAQSTIYSPLLTPLKVDTVSFGRTAQNATQLRALMKYNIPDLYSDRIIIAPEVIEEFFKQNIFSKDIKILIKKLLPYEASLFPIEKQFFNIVKNMAKTKPHYKLTDVIKTIAPDHNKALLKVQEPIFEKLNNLSKQMPDDQKKQYDQLMNIINKKLHREPILQPFSTKEFQYKMKRISDELKEKNDILGADLVDNLISFADKIPENIQPINKEHMTKLDRRKQERLQKITKKKQANLLTQLEMMWLDTDLKYNPELTKLFAQTRAKIYNIPIVVPFNRKSFIHDLKKITRTLEDQTLGSNMLKTAIKLPTSKQNLSAFVMKCVEFSPDKIGYDMFAGSIGNIEHLIPFQKNGADSIRNYAITSSYKNSERGSIDLSVFLQKNPKIYEYCQKQIDRLIQLHNDGTFRKVGLTKTYIINLAERLYKLSPSNNKLELNLDKLK